MSLWQQSIRLSLPRLDIFKSYSISLSAVMSWNSLPINLRGPIRSMSFNNFKSTLGNHLLSNKKLLHFLKNGLYENYRLFKDYLVLVKVILNQVYLLHSLVGLTLSTSFLSFFFASFWSKCFQHAMFTSK